ncbi:c-type cytochrome [Pseudocolwellia agarivorans]|uniref:c-type cytochrome n=1 Tax=Pseudocolwellia agarivorans TaxID=1911682 RepID=UPI0009845A2B|nr:c-type cytochrome [Pseudocolwellia agarivorans]
MNNLIKKGFNIICLFSFTIYAYAYDSDLNQKLKNMADKQEITAQGKVLFEQVCASCHSKDLSGASGFNLKDGEWIHGSQPSQIIENVKRGFADAGMLAFNNVFSELQLQSIVAYVLSKREGFEGLTYKIYQMEDANDKVISAEKIIKTGELASNLPDFQLPEIKHYAIEFEGDFYAPKDKDTKIWVEWGRPIDIDFYTDGEKIEREEPIWYPTWKLKKGKQHLKIIYRAGDNKPNQRNVSLIVTNPDRTIKLFPISTRAKDILSDNKLEVKATNQTIILRKTIHKLPSYSISVGLPSKVNYAFNTRSCSVVGLWKGDLLNIGPNISGRGESPSLPLGDWLFRSPETLHLNNTDSKSCTYKGYKLVKQEPVFTFTIENNTFTVTALSKKSDEITFNYRVIDNKNSSKFTVKLPKTNSLIWRTPNGKVTKNSATVIPDASGNFSIIATFTK